MLVIYLFMLCLLGNWRTSCAGYIFIHVVFARKLAAYDVQSQLAVHVCMDMLVVIDDLSEYMHVYENLVFAL